jgi:SnoaL-like domain/FAD binding domain
VGFSNTVDAVVVGPGAAGYSAAITARKHGADVIQLEKASRVGGTTRAAGGWIWVALPSRVSMAWVTASPHHSARPTRPLEQHLGRISPTAMSSAARSPQQNPTEQQESEEMTLTDIASQLDRIADEEAIARLIYAYCTGIDTGQFDDTARLFERGAWFLNPQTPFQGTEAVSRFLWENVITYDGVPGTRHVVSNIRTDVADDRRSAVSRSYVIVYQTVPDAMPEIIFQGAYDDTFARTDGEWHFVERHIETDGTGDMSRHLKSAQPAGSSSL